jgi:hypothetical protein
MSRPGVRDSLAVAWARGPAGPDPTDPPDLPAPFATARIDLTYSFVSRSLTWPGCGVDVLDGPERRISQDQIRGLPPSQLLGADESRREPIMIGV